MQSRPAGAYPACEAPVALVPCLCYAEGPCLHVRQTWAKLPSFSWAEPQAGSASQHCEGCSGQVDLRRSSELLVASCSPCSANEGLEMLGVLLRLLTQHARAGTPHSEMCSSCATPQTLHRSHMRPCFVRSGIASSLSTVSACQPGVADWGTACESNGRTAKKPEPFSMRSCCTLADS